jgi:hypothetical protein
VVQRQEKVRRRGLQPPSASTWGAGPPRAARSRPGARWVSGSTWPVWPRWLPSQRRSRAYRFDTSRCRTSGGWSGPSSTAPTSSASSSTRTTPSPCPTHPRSGHRVRPVLRGIPARRARHLQQLRRSELVWPPPQ